MLELSAARRWPQSPTRDWLRTLPPAARFVLQGGLDARAAASQILGVPLSAEACRAHSQGDRAALWLGPDEHLLLGSAADGETLAAKLSVALTGIDHSLVDVSHRQIALAVSGPNAAAILNAGCPLDLDAAAFPPGTCTRTLMAKADVVLWRRSTAEFQLEVWRSFSDYVSQWLQEAAQDFVAPMQPLRS